MNNFPKIVYYHDIGRWLRRHAKRAGVQWISMLNDPKMVTYHPHWDDPDHKHKYTGTARLPGVPDENGHDFNDFIRWTIKRDVVLIDLENGFESVLTRHPNAARVKTPWSWKQLRGHLLEQIEALRAHPSSRGKPLALYNFGARNQAMRDHCLDNLLEVYDAVDAITPGTHTRWDRMPHRYWQNHEFRARFWLDVVKQLPDLVIAPTVSGTYHLPTIKQIPDYYWFNARRDIEDSQLKRLVNLYEAKHLVVWSPHRYHKEKTGKWPSWAQHRRWPWITVARQERFMYCAVCDVLGIEPFPKLQAAV